MSSSIVTVNVSTTVAPTPSTLQSSGAFISQGGTTLSSNSYQLITQMSDLTAILTAPLAVTSAAWSGGTVTITTTAAHGITSSDTFLTTISGATPAVYNGTFLATSTGTDTFTYALASDGGTTPATGTILYTTRNVAELVAMGTTFFGQGASQAVYVLELGAGEPSTGVTALGTWITANPGTFYSYLVPRAWDGVAGFLTFLAGFESDTSKTYFFVTTTSGTYTDYTALEKCVFALIEAPTIPVTEFSVAAPFWVTLHYNPNATNRVTPTAFSYLFGVTPYPLKGNAATLATWKAAAINVVGTGAEGGISNTILLWGTTKDGNDFTYWYSIDWVQINIDLNISNAVINGSNNPINPLYYNQDGINRLQAVAAQTMSSGVSFGLVLGNVIQTALLGAALDQALDAGTYDDITVVNAIPFVPYNQENPGDYKIGKYAGFTIVYTPARGFIQIVFTVNVSQFVAQ